MKLFHRICVLFLLALFPIFAHATPCAGFADVDVTNPFCPNVDWVKNRKITLGCTAGAYCPDEYVTRLQMAAFMNRLGEAFTPLVLYQRQANVVVPSGSAHVCVVGSVTIADFRRFAHATSVVTAGMASGRTTVGSRPLFSTDSGVTWQSFHPAADDWAWADIAGPYPLIPFTSTMTMVTPDRAIFAATFLFAVEVLNNSVGVTMHVDCQLRVEITNRNGTNSPY
jgi:hypothetical protein